MLRKCPDLLDGLTTSLNSVSFCYMREKASIGISLLLSLIRKERSVTHRTLCVRPHVRNGYSFDYRLFHGFAAVCVHFALILGLMGQAARAAYAAAYARHALYEVLGQTVRAQLKQGHAALFYAVAGDRLDFKVDVLLLERLAHRVGQTAAAREYAAEVARVLQYVLFQSAHVDVAAVKQRLQLLKRKYAVHQILHAVALTLGLLGRARP